MADLYTHHDRELHSPAFNDEDVTPSDSADLAKTSRSLYITVGGTIKYTTLGGQTVTRTVPDNFVLPMRVTRVWSTGTTATGICNWY